MVYVTIPFFAHLATRQRICQHALARSLFAGILPPKRHAIAQRLIHLVPRRRLPSFSATTTYRVFLSNHGSTQLQPVNGTLGHPALAAATDRSMDKHQLLLVDGMLGHLALAAATARSMDKRQLLLVHGMLGYLALVASADRSTNKHQLLSVQGMLGQLALAAVADRSTNNQLLVLQGMLDHRAFVAAAHSTKNQVLAVKDMLGHCTLVAVDDSTDK